MDCSPWDSPGQITGAGSCFPSPEHLPDAGIEHRSPALWADSLPTGPPGKPDDEAEAYLALAFYLGTSLSQTCTMGSGDLVARLPWWLKQKRIQLSIQYRRLGFDPWVGKRMATHSSLLAWRIPWTEDPSGLHSGVGGGVSQKSRTRLSDCTTASTLVATWRTSQRTFILILGYSLDSPARNSGRQP